jgi:hypothetical protein
MSEKPRCPCNLKHQVVSMASGGRDIWHCRDCHHRVHTSAEWAAETNYHEMLFCLGWRSTSPAPGADLPWHPDCTMQAAGRPAASQRKIKLWHAACQRAELVVVIYEGSVIRGGHVIADLLREVLGDPQVPPDPEGLFRIMAHSGDALRLASAIYDRHAFDDMPVLADACEDAGVTDERLLAHLRGGARHVPGCWALDALLGRE